MLHSNVERSTPIDTASEGQTQGPAKVPKTKIEMILLPVNPPIIKDAAMPKKNIGLVILMPSTHISGMKRHHR